MVAQRKKRCCRHYKSNHSRKIICLCTVWTDQEQHESA
ncbi:hypothetical protein E3O62_10945 [Cryobacterium sp. TMT2-15-1]|nr:hypothetical protein E3O62_10945 [Cryobacterium sp. TMT2-15-1]